MGGATRTAKDGREIVNLFQGCASGSGGKTPRLSGVEILKSLGK
jgi:hypothetical protein